MNSVVAIQEKPLTSAAIQEQVNTIQHVMRDIMQKDVHFGTIPGTKAPSLYKPGAEKIMATFRLSADPEVMDMSDADQVRYQVKVKIVSASGVVVGFGIGECSSNEEKYKWRAAVCAEEFADTPPTRKREKWVKGKWDNNTRSYGKPAKIQQVRTEPADLANTILKMAKKRGLIDGVLTTTAASDIFTQDIEDLPEEYLAAQESEQRQPEAAKQLPDYPETEFQKNLPAYRSAVEAGKRTGQQVIDTIGTKYTVTASQQETLRALKVKPAEEPQA